MKKVGTAITVLILAVALPSVIKGIGKNPVGTEKQISVVTGKADKIVKDQINLAKATIVVKGNWAIAEAKLIKAVKSEIVLAKEYYSLKQIVKEPPLLKTLKLKDERAYRNPEVKIAEVKSKWTPELNTILKFGKNYEKAWYKV